MGNDRYARYAAASGLVAAVLIVGAFVAFILPNAPDLSASGDEWKSFFTDHQSRIQFGTIVAGVGLFFFLWFLGAVRSALAAAAGANGRLATTAVAGGVIAVATLFVAITATSAAALRPDELDPNLTRALDDIGVVAGGPGAAGFTAFFAAVAIAGYRYRPIPAPIAGFSALAAITQPLAYGVGVTDSGAFAADGVLGGFIPIITFLIAMVTLSWALMRPAVPDRPAVPQ